MKKRTTSGTPTTQAQRRTRSLGLRCYSGYNRKGSELKIDENTALKEWKEFLDGRIEQKRNGGDDLVNEIADIVRNMRTPSTGKGGKAREGLDLSDRPVTLKFLKEWYEVEGDKRGYNPQSFHMRAVRCTAQRNARREALQARKCRPHCDEGESKRARTSLEIMTQACEDARKTFEERMTKALKTFEERMTKAEEEARKTIADAEEEARNAHDEIA